MHIIYDDIGRSLASSCKLIKMFSRRIFTWVKLKESYFEREEYVIRNIILFLRIVAKGLGGAEISQEIIYSLY